MKSAAEKRKRAAYTCSSCKMTGHNASTYPEVAKQQQQRVLDFFNYGDVRESSEHMEPLVLGHSVLAKQCGTQEGLLSWYWQGVIWYGCDTPGIDHLLSLFIWSREVCMLFYAF